MGVRISKKINKPATLKLYDHITTYLFAQEYGEFRGQSREKAQAFLEQLDSIL